MSDASSLLPEALWERVAAFLTERYTLALATNGPQGLWVATVYFAGNLAQGGTAFYFLSAPHTRHGQNLAAEARVSAAIDEDEHDWRRIRGVQLEGSCHQVTTPREALRAWRAYLGKFPIVRQLLRGGGVDTGTTARMARTRMYTLRPTHLFYLDNELGFGTRREIEGV